MDRLLWTLNALGVVFIALGLVADTISAIGGVWQALWSRPGSHVPCVAPALYVLGCLLAQVWMSPGASMVGLCLIVFHFAATILLPSLVYNLRKMVI